MKTKVQLQSWSERVPPNRLERQAKKKKAFIFLLAGLLLVCILVYLLVYSSIFRIEKIVISGINEVDNFNAVQLAVQKYTEGFKFGILPKNNIWLINKNQLARFIDENAPVEEVVISKEFRTLEIGGREKLPVLIWQEGEQNYYLDKSGWVMAAVAEGEIKYDLPTINRGTTTAIVVGAQIIDSKSVDFIEGALEELKEGLRGWPIKKIEVKDFANREVNFYTHEGWYIILDIEGDMGKTLANLNNFLRQEGVDSKKLHYVDLRIPDKIFYK